MHALASFAMRSRWTAALVAALGVVLSLLLPPALLVGMAAVALVTLRQGGRDGMTVLVLGALAITVLMLPLSGLAALPLAGLIMLLFWLPLWLLAVVLRATVSLAWTFGIATLLSTVVVVAFYALLADPVGWWQQLLTTELKPLFTSTGMVADEAGLDEWFRLLASLMPGIVAASLLLNLLLSLLLGRWWQALLYNPGGFQREFHDLRLGRGLALATLVLTALALTLKLPLLINLLWVLSTVYVFQGLALIHGLVHKARLARGWLVGFYVLMVFAPQFLSFLCLLALVDAWVDFRARVKPRRGA